MRTKRVVFLALAAALMMALWGCGSNRDSDGATTGQGTDIEDAQTVGINNCLNCHGTGEGEAGAEWLDSRHANILTVDEKLALNEWNDFDADDVDPQPDNESTTCIPCHNPLGDGQLIDNALADQPERMVIGCESCHGGGQFHRGIGPIPFPTPGPDQCGQCHGVTEALFHSTSVFRNITDTHDDLDTTAALVEGYVVKVNQQTGCVDCHYSAHDFDLTINNQWAQSGHAGNLYTIKEDEEAAGGNLAAVKVVGTDAEPFIHSPEINGWDNIEEVGCQRCHTATGGRNFLNGPMSYLEAVEETEALIPDDPTQADLEAAAAVAPNDYSHLSGWTAPTGSPETELIYCWVCHSDSDATLRDPGEIPFPSGAVQSLGDGSNVCMGCHQGRESGQTVAEATPTGTETGLRFINRHYFAAAAIFFGTEVTAGYEYAGKTYIGPPPWPAIAHENLDTCAGCHLREGAANHLFEPDLARCQECHDSATSFEEIGIAVKDADFDGDGVAEGFQGEIDTFAADLLAAMQSYATNTIGTNLGYRPGSYPYFFIDTDNSGTIEDAEAVRTNAYPGFDAKLLRAAFNFHSAQDPCSDIHNHRYVIQTLYDSIEDLGGSVAGYTRPVTPE